MMRQTLLGCYCNAALSPEPSFSHLDWHTLCDLRCSMSCCALSRLSSRYIRLGSCRRDSSNTGQAARSACAKKPLSAATQWQCWQLAVAYRVQRLPVLQAHWVERNQLRHQVDDSAARAGCRGAACPICCSLALAVDGEQVGGASATAPFCLQQRLARVQRLAHTPATACRISGIEEEYGDLDPSSKPAS